MRREYNRNEGSAYRSRQTGITKPSDARALCLLLAFLLAVFVIKLEPQDFQAFVIFLVSPALAANDVAQPVHEMEAGDKVCPCAFRVINLRPYDVTVKVFNVLILNVVAFLAVHVLELIATQSLHSPPLCDFHCSCQAADYRAFKAARQESMSLLLTSGA